MTLILLRALLRDPIEMTRDPSHQLQETQNAYDVPELKTDDEAADWFGTDNTSGLDVEEVSLPPRGHLLPVAIRLPEAEVNELKRRSRRPGIGSTTYIRMLVNRHVLDEPPIG